MIPCEFDGPELLKVAQKKTKRGCPNVISEWRFLFKKLRGGGSCSPLAV